MEGVKTTRVSMGYLFCIFTQNMMTLLLLRVEGMY